MRRLGAGIIDLVGSVLLAGLLASTIGWFLAEQAVATFHIYERDSVWNGPLPLVIGAVSPLVYALAPAWILMTAGEALWGTSPGKLAAGLEIFPLGGAGRRALVRRWLGKAAGGVLICAGLLGERWEVVAAGGVWTVAAAVLALISLATRRAPLGDGWTVIRRRRGIRPVPEKGRG